MTLSLDRSVSVIIPAKNEATSLVIFLKELHLLYPHFELIVVNDGSSDNTAQVAKDAGAIVVNHPYSMGNGASIKSGVRIATGSIFILMDGDGQHQIKDIAPLLNKFEEGYDMVVGARDKQAQASCYRRMANGFGNRLASMLVGHKIADLTSGFRVVNALKLKEFLHLLPNGFSTPTTLTMAFFRSGFTVAFLPIEAKSRIGKSHLRVVTESIRFLLIIYKMTVLYSPLKIFLPLAFCCLFAGLSNYAYSFYTTGRLTNMTVVLFCAGIIIFLIGLVSEQITALMYSQRHIIFIDKQVPIAHSSSPHPKNQALHQ